MTTEAHNFTFFQQALEKDKENIQRVKQAMEQLPLTKRKIFEQHERYTKAIQDLKKQIAKETNCDKKMWLQKELECYENSLALIEPGFRESYVALQSTLLDNLTKIHKAQALTEQMLKEKNTPLEPKSQITPRT